MAGFRYEAIDRSGKVKKGVLNAESARQARVRIREQGLTPIDVGEIRKETSGEQSHTPWVGKVSASRLCLVTRQFAGLLAAGITVENSLKTLIGQTESQALRHALAGVRGEVMEGSSLAAAMRKFPAVFPELYYSLVEAGESSGKLDVVLMKFADYMEHGKALKEKVTLALVYPVIVSIVAMAVTLGLLVYVIPQVVSVFQRTHQTLPMLTQTLIFISSFLMEYGFLILLALLAVAIAFWRLVQIESWRRVLHSAMLKTPFIGRLVRGINSARLSSALAILVGGGVPLLSSLKAGIAMVGSLPMRDALEEVIDDVTKGGSLSASLERTGMYPPVMTSFIANGENSGKLGEMLERSSSQLSNELEYRLAAFTSLLEPALILTMGLVVLTMALGILMPIFEMNQLAR